MVQKIIFPRDATKMAVDKDRMVKVITTTEMDVVVLTIMAVVVVEIEMTIDVEMTMEEEIATGKTSKMGVTMVKVISLTKRFDGIKLFFRETILLSRA